MCSPWSINSWGWCLGSDTKKLKSHLSGGARLLQPRGLEFQDQDRNLHLLLFNISGQGTGEIKEGPQSNMGCNYLCQPFLQVVDLVAEGPESRSDVEAFVLQLFFFFCGFPSKC